MHFKCRSKCKQTAKMTHGGIEPAQDARRVKGPLFKVLNRRAKCLPAGPAQHTTMHTTYITEFLPHLFPSILHAADLMLFMMLFLRIADTLAKPLFIPPPLGYIIGGRGNVSRGAPAPPGYISWWGVSPSTSEHLSNPPGCLHLHPIQASFDQREKALRASSWLLDKQAYHVGTRSLVPTCYWASILPFKKATLLGPTAIYSRMGFRGT